jgi:hypothetical protein
LVITAGCGSAGDLARNVGPEHSAQQSQALEGTNVGGMNVGGMNVGGMNVGGMNVGGMNVGGMNVGGMNVGGMNVGGMNVGGTSSNSVAGTNLSASNLAGGNSGFNIHDIAIPTPSNQMLYSAEDLWSPANAPGPNGGRCIAWGIGSTEFSTLLGQQSPNARMSVALGKLPWGFADTAGGPIKFDAWEAVVWGDRTYCTFVVVAPPSTSWTGMAGFIKAVFRWQAPPTQAIDISGIEASAAVDPTVQTSISTYTGMMDTGEKWRSREITAMDMIAGELAFITATTNNRPVMVDFSSWMRDAEGNGIVLGNVESTNPPSYAEAMYSVVDNGDDTVAVVVGNAAPAIHGGVPSSIVDSTADLDAAYRRYLDGASAKPIPKRCAAALYLNKIFGEPIPEGKCDSGIAWSDISCEAGAEPWTSVPGTTAPMNEYMRLGRPGSAMGMAVDGTCNLKPVISQTYIHLWAPSYELGE